MGNWESVYANRFVNNGGPNIEMKLTDQNTASAVAKFKQDFGDGYIDNQKLNYINGLSERLKEHNLGALDMGAATDGTFASMIFDERLLADLMNSGNQAIMSTTEWIRQIKIMSDEVGKIFTGMSQQNRDYMVNNGMMTKQQLDFAVKLGEYAKGAANEMFMVNAIDMLKNNSLIAAVKSMQTIYDITKKSTTRMDARLYTMFGIQGVGNDTTVNWNGPGSGGNGGFPTSDTSFQQPQNNGPVNAGGEWYQKSMANIQAPSQQGTFSVYGNQPWTQQQNVGNPWQQPTQQPVNTGNPWQQSPANNPWQQPTQQQPQNNGGWQQPQQQGWNTQPVNNNGWQQPQQQQGWNNMAQNNWQQNGGNTWGGQQVQQSPWQQPVNNNWNQQPQQSTIPADWNIVI